MAAITAFCLPWHTRESEAFTDILVTPLKPWCDIRLKGWDGVHLPAAEGRTDVQIFCELPPPEEALRGPASRTVWIPMWDWMPPHSAPLLNAFPKWLRVVAFCEEVARRTEAAGLPTLRLKYYTNPDAFAPATWENGRVLLYWNRTGMVGPEFLERLCVALRVDRLIFHNRIDPDMRPEARYELPERLGCTDVTEIQGLLPREDYIRATSAANIFLAPRLREGVGLSFLEQMARGCAVLAFNGAMMNEYIVDRRTGWLFNVREETRLSRAARALGLNRAPVPQNVPYPVTTQQYWRALARLDLERVGRAARQAVIAGFADWKKTVPDFARFILGEL